MSESQSPNKQFGTETEQRQQMTPEEEDTIKGFLLDNPPETVGGNLNDTDRIKGVLDETVEYYHNQLPDFVRDLITLKWGIKDSTINNIKIGYTGEGHGLISHLEAQGYHPIEILRAGVGSDRLLKHIYECDPEGDACWHDFDDTIDTLARARENGSIEKRQIDLYALHDYYESKHGHYPIRDWWDNRIVFPYQNENGDYSYMIGRETQWTDDRPGKYLKQTVKKDWINTDAVYEPMYGCHTMEPGKPLLLTEGITDAIMAHQEDVMCIAPVTKKFKKAHYPQLLEYAKMASGVVIANDNEETGEGLKGALDTAMFLRNNDIEARIGILPRNENEEKVDLAEFLRTHSRSELTEVLMDSIPPQEHPYYNEMKERERNRLGAEPGEAEDGKLGVDNVDPDSAKSAIFEAKLGDVLDVRNGYRGDHPLGHHGDDHSDYFVVYEEHGDKRARDFKVGYNYNALTWLAVASGARSRSHPAGRLSDEETFEAWKHAKEQGYIPDDDPAPARALWHIARTHSLAPEGTIPSSMDDDTKMPPTCYNRVLETIENEYGLTPGRETLNTTDNE